MEMDAQRCWNPCRDSKDTIVPHSQPPAPGGQEKGLHGLLGQTVTEQCPRGRGDSSMGRGAELGASTALLKAPPSSHHVVRDLKLCESCLERNAQRLRAATPCASLLSPMETDTAPRQRVRVCAAPLTATCQRLFRAAFLRAAPSPFPTALAKELRTVRIAAAATGGAPSSLRGRRIRAHRYE